MPTNEYVTVWAVTIFTAVVFAIGVVIGCWLCRGGG